MSPFRPGLFYHAESAGSKPLVGCSACLLGEPVRYDGGHRQQDHFSEWLAPWLQLQAICPEVGIGLGVPRPTLKVVDGSFDRRVVHVESPGDDVTDALLDYADSYLRDVGRFWPLSGYIFKARSPSCGVGSTPVNPGEDNESRGYGAFAGRFRRVAPWLTLVEEEDLASQDDCLAFIARCFICRDILWQRPTAPTAPIADHYRRLFGSDFGEESDRGRLWVEIRDHLDSLPAPLRQEWLDPYLA